MLVTPAAAAPQAAPGPDAVEWRGLFPPPPPLASAPLPAPVLVPLGLARVPLLFAVAFEPAPGGDSPWLRPAVLGPPGPAPASVLRPGAALATRIARPPPEEETAEGGPVSFLPELPPEPEAAVIPGTGPIEFRDLDVRILGRGEFGGDWTRFRPCDTGIQLGCQPGLLPRLVPELQFGVQMGGTISDRVVVNVDYDQTREFSATNNINVFYQGVEDEILQGIEVGDVTFGLPDSRFLTEGIPAGNFGLRATGQLGPVDFETVFAQQRGDLSSREFRLAGAGTDRAFVQEDTIVVDNADYVRGQFFFLADPRNLFDYPHIDILGADPSTVPSSAIPGAEPIQLYRFENDPVTRQQVEGYIQADASATLGDDTVTESGWFRYLQAGRRLFRASERPVDRACAARCAADEIAGGDLRHGPATPSATTTRSAFTTRAAAPACRSCAPRSPTTSRAGPPGTWRCTRSTGCRVRTTWRSPRSRSTFPSAS